MPESLPQKPPKSQKTGAVLGIVSKNNLQDVVEVFEQNTNMVLKQNDFAVEYINWKRKDENIASAARDLNIGIDSIVFLDDNPVERSLVESSLPDVTVLQFPDDVADLPNLLESAYELLFKPRVLTDEARAKTEQYAARAKSASLRQSISDYGEYLDALEMHIRRVDSKEHLARIAELIGKTNQFNIAANRFTLSELENMLAQPNSFKIYAFELTDKFTNNGIIAAAVMSLDEDPAIIELVMSCRVMERQVENYIVDYIERDAMSLGLKTLGAQFKPTKRNAPCSSLFNELGYSVVNTNDEGIQYRIDLNERPAREYHLKER